MRKRTRSKSSRTQRSTHEALRSWETIRNKPLCEAKPPEISQRICKGMSFCCPCLCCASIYQLPRTSHLRQDTFNTDGHALGPLLLHHALVCAVRRPPFVRLKGRWAQFPSSTTLLKDFPSTFISVERPSQLLPQAPSPLHTL